MAINDIRVDRRATTVKPLHANWLISAITTLSDKKDMIRKPFEELSILLDIEFFVYISLYKNIKY